MNKELNRIQKEIKAPKSQRNTFGKYNYRNAEDILEAYKKIAGDTTLVMRDEILLIGERYYIQATATLSLDEKEVSSSAYAREPLDKKGMDSAQITGATSSYARKYALNALFAIDDTKDADTQDNSEVDTTKYEKELAKIENKEELREYYTKNAGKGKEVADLILAKSKEIETV